MGQFKHVYRIGYSYDDEAGRHFETATICADSVEDAHMELHRLRVMAQQPKALIFDTEKVA